MDKPITLRKRDLEDNLINVINDSGLPAFVIGYVLSDIRGQVKQMEVRQLGQDEDAWNRFQQGENDVHCNGNPTEQG